MLRPQPIISKKSGMSAIEGMARNASKVGPAMRAMKLHKPRMEPSSTPMVEPISRPSRAA